MKTEPMEHQANIQPAIAETKGFGILWEMGLGKTWIGCWLLNKEFHPEKKYLIISPNSVTDTWYNEIQTHTHIPAEKVCILRGSKSQRVKALNNPELQIFIINYEGLRVLESELLEKHFRLIIADESQRIKNPKAQQTKIALRLRGDIRLILSGTAILNSLLDVFSQWQFMDQGKTFGNNFYAFRNTYFYDTNAGRFRGTFADWKLREGSEDKIKNLMAGSCHRLEKKDCLDLPEKIYRTEYAFLTKEQMEHYKMISEEAITYIQSEAVTANVALTKLLRLNQITSGFLKTVDGNEVDLEKNPKMSLLKETVSEIMDANAENKVIIWAVFRHDIEMIAKAMEQYNPVIMYGGIKDRDGVVKTFQNDTSCRVFVGQPASAGIGITLTAANYAIYYSYNFSLEARLQSEDRCHRKGSEIHKSIVYIDLVCKDTIDEIIIASVRKKSDAAQDVMDYIKKGGVL